MILMQLLRQRTVILMLVLVVLGMASYAYAQSFTPPPPSAQQWIVTNLWAIVVIAFHIGITWRQLLDDRARIAKLEAAIDREIPETYVRKDVLNETLARLTFEMAAWRETFGYLNRRPDRRGGAVDS